MAIPIWYVYFCN